MHTWLHLQQAVALLLNSQQNLEPPFSQAEQLLRSSSPAQSPGDDTLVLPATYHDDKFTIHRVQDGVNAWVEQELDISRLDRVHHRLWLAGRPMSARSLHRQLLMNRTIVVTEKTDMHLVWRDSRIFIKPLPAMLLNYEFWTQHILDQSLHSVACGLLLSYAWLICYESDFHIAQDKQLLPKSLTYGQWTAFANAFMSKIDFVHFTGIHRRYQYGELRLPRLNIIYRWTQLGHFTRGFFYDYYRYSNFFERNFGWLFIIFAVITVVLAAMQVGLATKALADNHAFDRASYGFAIASIALIPAAFGVVALLLLYFVANNAWATVVFLNQKRHLWRTKQSIV